MTDSGLFFCPRSELNMNIIDCAAAVDAVTDQNLRAILDRYMDMLDLATIFTLEVGDTLKVLAKARGRALEDFEFVTSHPGGWLEAVCVISDFGEGHIILVRDEPGIDPVILSILRDQAVPASSLGQTGGNEDQPPAA